MCFLHWSYNGSGVFGRGHGEVEANPKTDVNTPWGGVGDGSLPLRIGIMGQFTI